MPFDIASMLNPSGLPQTTAGSQPLANMFGVGQTGGNFGNPGNAVGSMAQGAAFGTGLNEAQQQLDQNQMQNQGTAIALQNLQANQGNVAAARQLAGSGIAMQQSGFNSGQEQGIHQAGLEAALAKATADKSTEDVKDMANHASGMRVASTIAKLMTDNPETIDSSFHQGMLTKAISAAGMKDAPSEHTPQAIKALAAGEPYYAASSDYLNDLAKTKMVQGSETQRAAMGQQADIIKTSISTAGLLTVAQTNAQTELSKQLMTGSGIFIDAKMKVQQQGGVLDPSQASSLLTNIDAQYKSSPEFAEVNKVSQGLATKFAEITDQADRNKKAASLGIDTDSMSWKTEKPLMQGQDMASAWLKQQTETYEKAYFAKVLPGPQDGHVKIAPVEGALPIGVPRINTTSPADAIQAGAAAGRAATPQGTAALAQGNTPPPPANPAPATSIPMTPPNTVPPEPPMKATGGLAQSVYGDTTTQQPKPKASDLAFVKKHPEMASAFKAHFGIDPPK